MSIQKLILIAFFLICICGNCFSQSKVPEQLKTPFQSLTRLSNALLKNDSLAVKKIVTKDGYANIKSQNLYQYGEKWLSSVKEKKISIFHESKNLKILYIRKEIYLLSFVFEEKAKEWKFNAFITQP